MLRRVLVAVLLAGAMIGPTLQSVPARVPALRQAVPVVIDFEDLTTTPWGTGGQTVVSGQYAAQGVTFNDPMAIDFAGGSFGDPTFLHSGSNAIQHCYSQEDCDTPLVMTFAEPQHRVKVWVGFWDSLSEALMVELTAFDAESGGDAIASTSATLGPGSDPQIPIQTPLEVTVNGNAIRRVEVGFSPPSDLALRLVFDDVEFESSPSIDLPSCPADTARPDIVLEQPASELTAQLNLFTLKGRVTTSTDLEEATLTATTSAGTRSMNIGTDLIAPSGESFGPVRIKDLLLPGTNTIMLTARNCADTGRARESITFEPIEDGTRYELLGMEVTQTIQDLDNSVSLIAGKRTFVRVYLRTRGGTNLIQSVSGTLRGCHVPVGVLPDCLSSDSEFEPLPSLKSITVNDSDDLIVKRTSMEGSLYFELPAEWTNAGLLRLELDSESLSPRLPCDNCDGTVNGEPRAYLFEKAPPLRVKLGDATYTLSGKPFAPSATDHARLKSWLLRAFPTSDVMTSDLGELVFYHQPTCQEVNETMYAAEFSALNASATSTPDARQRHYGLMVFSDTAAIAGCIAPSEIGPYWEQFAVGAAGSTEGHEWDEDGSFADYYGGHELAHTLGRMHPGFCGKNEDSDKDYPYVREYISNDDFAFFGFDPGDATDADNVIKTRPYSPYPWSSLMTYCPHRWISSYTYEAILSAMLALESTPAGLTRLAASPRQEVLLLLGTIDLTKKQDAIDFRPFSLATGNLVTRLPSAARTDFRIVLEDRLGADLHSYPFEARKYLDTDDRTAQLAEVVPWDPRTGRIFITYRGQEIGSRDVGVHAPHPQITSPNGGESLQDASHLATWTATDADTDVDELTYTLLYSTDAGSTWRNVATGIKERQYSLDLSRLPGSDQALLRVIASDGVLTGEDDSDAVFSVPPKYPEVGIVSPVSGTSFGTSQTIVLVGTASDVEQGEFDDASLRWSSDIQGALGEGRSIAVSDLTPGRHTITLTATDSDGLATDASIVIEILEDDLPILEWSAASGSSFVPHGQFAYDSDDAVGTFYTSDGEGGITPVRTLDPLLNGWTVIVPGSFSGNDDFTDLLFYAAQPGLGEFYASDGEGGLRLLSGSEGFTKGWDLIVPGNFGGDDDRTDLFFYNAEEGEGKFYTTDGEGRIRLLGTPESFLRGWSSIVPGNFGGDAHTDLLFYDKTTGLARFYATDGEGGLELLSEDPDWTVGWDQIVPGNFSGDDWTDVFLYDAETGDGAFSTTDGEGGIVPLGLPDTFLTTWSIIIAGDFGGNDDLTDLFFYDAERGLGEFYTTDGQGGLEPLSSTASFAQGWDQIIPGHFGGA
jgi:hypothetical protein